MDESDTVRDAMSEPYPIPDPDDPYPLPTPDTDGEPRPAPNSTFIIRRVVFQLLLIIAFLMIMALALSHGTGFPS